MVSSIVLWQLEVGYAILSVFYVVSGFVFFTVLNCKCVAKY